MPRKLKTFTTSIGFFDLAIAAPSMKAALEAWGSNQNLFHQGLAEETDDPEIVEATLAHPGVVLRRAVGTTGAFKESAELPKNLPASAPTREAKKKAKPAKKLKPPRNADPKAQKAAVIQFEKEKAKREKQREKEEAERRKEEAAEARDEERRQRAVEKAEAIRDRARERHEEKLAALQKERGKLDDQIEAEKNRWEDEESDLAEKIREARK
jgi:hypothetical protein